MGHSSSQDGTTAAASVIMSSCWLVLCMKEEEKRQNPTLLPGAGVTVRAKATLSKSEPSLNKASMSPECAHCDQQPQKPISKGLLSMPG
ncbi:hypothetical protein ACRRTK_011156 [Alexandromys fortis]